MFYFKVTSYRVAGRRHEEHREFLKPSHLGDFIATRAREPGITEISLRRISQRDYIAATRPKE